MEIDHNYDEGGDPVRGESTKPAPNGQGDGVAPRPGTSEVIDPASLSILGCMLIGAILAARVKRLGLVEFYEGIPNKLPNVVRAGLELAAS